MLNCDNVVKNKNLKGCIKKYEVLKKWVSKFEISLGRCVSFSELNVFDKTGANIHLVPRFTFYVFICLFFIILEILFIYLFFYDFYNLIFLFSIFHPFLEIQKKIQ